MISADRVRPGLLAEYASPQSLRSAVERLRAEGYRRLDAFTPCEVDGLDDLMLIPRTRLPRVTLVAGLLGATAGYFVQWYANSWDFPIDVGGRPIHPMPAYVVITFETMVLCAAIATFVAFFLACDLPRLWTPLEELAGFERVTSDRYWVAVDRRDPRFDPDRTRELLLLTAPLRIVDPPAARDDGEDEE